MNPNQDKRPIATEPPAHVRRYVKDLLERAPAYQALAADDKRALAQDLVKVMGFLAQSGAPLPGTPLLASAQLWLRALGQVQIPVAMPIPDCARFARVE